MYIYIREMHDIMDWISFGLLTKLRKRFTYDDNHVQTCNTDCTPQSIKSLETPKKNKEKPHHKKGALKILRKRSLSPFRGHSNIMPRKTSTDSSRTLIGRSSTFENSKSLRGCNLYHSGSERIMIRKASVQGSAEVDSQQQGKERNYRRILHCQGSIKKPKSDTDLYRKSYRLPDTKKKENTCIIVEPEEKKVINNNIPKRLPDVNESQNQPQYLTPLSSSGKGKSRSDSVVSSVTSENTVHNIRVVFDNLVMPGIPSGNRRVDYDIASS